MNWNEDKRLEEKRLEDILSSIRVLENARSGELEEDSETALQFMLGSRGRYVITKAIMYGLVYMDTELDHYKEYSDMADIKYLVKNLKLTKDWYWILEEEIERNTKRREYVNREIIEELLDRKKKKKNGK